MPYAIELYFDYESSKQIERIHLYLKSNGITVDEGTKPHISLAIFEDLPIEIFNKELENFSKNLISFELSFSSIGIFLTDSNVIYLAPKVTSKLLEIQKNFYDFFEKYIDKAWEYYLPNNWVPHCTLAMNISTDEIKETIGLLKDIEIPLKIRIAGIGILEFKPNQQISEYQLKQHD